MYVLYITKEDGSKSYYNGVYNGFTSQIEDAFKIRSEDIPKFERYFPNYKKEKVQ